MPVSATAKCRTREAGGGRAGFPPAVIPSRFHPYRQHDFSLFRELHRIVEQVEQNLPQAGHIAGNGGRNFLGNLIGQFQTFIRRPGYHQIQGAFNTAAQVEGLVLQFHLAGFDLREVQNIIDDTQESLAAGANRLGEFALLRREWGIEQQIGHADDPVHRGANFVAHRGQKHTLGLIGGFGPLPGLPGFGIEAGIVQGDGGQFRKTPQQFLFLVAKDLAGIPVAGQTQDPGGLQSGLKGNSHDYCRWRRNPIPGWRPVQPNPGNLQ